MENLLIENLKIFVFKSFKFLIKTLKEFSLVYLEAPFYLMLFILASYND